MTHARRHVLIAEELNRRGRKSWNVQVQETAAPGATASPGGQAVRMEANRKSRSARPRRRQSGKSEKPSRLANHGNQLVRHNLWNAARSAVMYNPLCSAYFEQLVARGNDNEPHVLAFLQCVMPRPNVPIPAASGSQPAVPPPGDTDSAAMVPLCSVFRRHLRQQNLKYTSERAEILNAIIERDDIFEAEQLLIDMRERGYDVSKATIYRTLKLLQDAGIITEALFDSKQSHFHLVYGRTERDYLVCVETGEVVEFSDPALRKLRERICREHGWSAVSHRFQIYGRSPRAPATPGSPATGRASEG
ncbi:MAG: transcriptional repressor [Phycisphaerales bacterium]